MPIEATLISQTKELIEKYDTISILTHINPDADTIGTALGVYTLLKQNTTKKLEIINTSDTLPRHLDFLQHFARFKKKMDFENSLVISCDCATASRLGVDIKDKKILNIDHHSSNECYGSVNVIMPQYASASLVAYELFKDIYPISKESAEAFYTALLSDTRYFTTSSVDKQTFSVAQELIGLGADAYKVAYNLTQRKSLASLRILQRALNSLDLRLDAQIGFLSVSLQDIKASGATMPDMDGVVDYAKSLACVKIGVFIMELEDSYRISMRSKGLDISKVAQAFGGGGHKVACGFSIDKTDINDIKDKILKQIENTGLLNG